jgi:hypothetical protein
MSRERTRARNHERRPSLLNSKAAAGSLYGETYIVGGFLRVKHLDTVSCNLSLTAVIPSGCCLKLGDSATESADRHLERVNENLQRLDARRPLVWWRPKRRPAPPGTLRQAAALRGSPSWQGIRNKSTCLLL